MRTEAGEEQASKQVMSLCNSKAAAAAAAAVRGTVPHSPQCAGCCLLRARHCQLCAYGQGQGECQTVPLTLLPIILLRVPWRRLGRVDLAGGWVALHASAMLQQARGHHYG
ncbi:hypothetical protein E2C01_014137 [Portunus trituberculatus]|uniref:Uncharacterized protein n=1 Tax=Portunus trituberculatus TaxID=210409 RepID=A0A5B7DI06_PORTR|nr:hypothetical protein [Portunus trituberculatus]